MDSIHDDTAKFASLLTRLKERTGRSYAALARPLGMHASTLHRYCAGEAVPQDFAGIERFAVLCGASPEERVELHRRWIMAVAARRRPQPSDARRASTPPETTSTATSAATPATTPAAVPAASANRGSPAAEAPEPTPPAEPRPRTGRPRAGRPRRRSVRATVSAVSLVFALAGLTVAVAVAVAGPFSADGESSVSARTAPEPSVSAAHRGVRPQKHRANTRAASPSASARTAPEPSASATHSSGGSRKNRANAGAAPPATPLTWTVDSHTRGLFGCGETYVVAKPPRQVPPPPHPEDVAAWAASQRAVHGSATGVQITVQGRGSAPVSLEALHVRVVNRAAPAADRGAAYYLGDGCGAGIVPRHFSVDLDEHQPLARSTHGDSNGTGPTPPAIDFPYRVSLQEPEVLVVSSTNESCTCDWYLDLDWSSGGRTGTVRIDDHGRPFRSTSSEGLTNYQYDRVNYRPGRWFALLAPETAATED
ncbi:helix-turn-helix domain-containing protein [Streptomyces populi]|uniref:helix-turn-helix domain-containing protein n=1 Tax=Streptomyces populi TaxID=2058924 RepID=UPI0035DF6D6A